MNLIKKCAWPQRVDEINKIQVNSGKGRQIFKKVDNH